MDNWPLPPFFKDGRDAGELAPVEALVFTRDGQSMDGRLLQFLPSSLRAVFQVRGEAVPRTLDFTALKSLQLIQPIPLVPDEELIGLYQGAGGQIGRPDTRAFMVRFVDGEQLRGQTFGIVRTRQGLFIFLVTQAPRAVRIFVPEGALVSYQVGGLLGQQLVERQVVQPEQVSQALAEQARRREAALDQHLGDGPVQDPAALAARLGRLHPFAPVRLGDLLMNQGLVSREQMLEALGRMKRDRQSRLGDILVEMGALTRAQLAQAISEQLAIPFVSLSRFESRPELLGLVPQSYAVEHQVLPLLATDKALVVALESPVDADYLDELRFSTQRQIVPVMADRDELAARIAADYAFDASTSGGLRSIEDEIAELAQRTGGSVGGTAAEPRRLVSENDTLVVRVVNKMIIDAHQRGASDIHVEAYPDEQPTRIRLRIDGVLSDYLQLPWVLRAAVISRLKIMADLDISEHRKPQDGKIDFSRFAPLKLELRVASLPTVNGLEDIVMRLLSAAKPIPLDDLGMAPALVAQLRGMVHRSYGLFLVCGPTGSGKTTTLHSLLAEVNTSENKIWTAEDPIEITHPGLRQIQMLPRAGLTFATAMRAFLRADPDIIMVGEMRDSETAHMAIEASLTGHLVMSTLHTNSAPESVIRLLDMGLDPFNFADALVGVLGQRLARRLCPACKVPVADAAQTLAELAQEYAQDIGRDAATVLADWQAREPPPALYEARGCPRCNQTGYKGRVGLYELMAASPAIKKLVQTRSPVEQLFRCATAEGMLTLRQYGLLKVLEGVTDARSVRNACA